MKTEVSVALVAGADPSISDMYIPGWQQPWTANVHAAARTTKVRPGGRRAEEENK